jgi:hypothetical protein
MSTVECADGFLIQRRFLQQNDRILEEFARKLYFLYYGM